MKRIAFAIVLFFAVGASADALQEWKTPAGKIYFGDQPPAGSVAVKKVEKRLGTVDVANPPPLPRADTRAVWHADSTCADLRISETQQEPTNGIDRRIVRGTVTHEGAHLVRDAKVCAARTCKELRGGDTMVKGDQEPFELDVVGVADATNLRLRVECSVSAPAA